jgi:hypothetical protein
MVSWDGQSRNGWSLAVGHRSCADERVTQRRGRALLRQHGSQSREGSLLGQITLPIGQGRKWIGRRGCRWRSASAHPMYTYPRFLIFLGVRPNLLTIPSTNLLLLPGVTGSGIGGITSTSILSLSSLLRLFLLHVLDDLVLNLVLALLTLLILLTLLVLSPLLRGRQNTSPSSSFSLSDELLQRDSFLLGVPIATNLRLRMTPSRARSTPLSEPDNLK